MEIASLLIHRAASRPHHEALRCDGTSISYRELNAHANRLAHALRALGLTRDSRIATLLSNSIDHVVIFWAAAKLGALLVPIAPGTPRALIKTILLEAEPAALFAERAAIPMINSFTVGAKPMHCILTDGDALGYLELAMLSARAPDTEPAQARHCGEELCHLMFAASNVEPVSGIVFTQQARATGAMLLAAALRLQASSVLLQTRSLCCNETVMQLLACTFAGATFVLQHRFDADELIDTLCNDNVTHLSCEAQQAMAMVHAPHFHPEKAETLAMLLLPAATLALEHKRHIDALLPGRLAECHVGDEGLFTMLDHADVLKKHGSFGVALPFSRIGVGTGNGSNATAGTIGEIRARSPIIAAGYWRGHRRAGSTFAGGWLHTGKTGFVDADGHLYLSERPAQHESPAHRGRRDIEAIVLRHPQVRDAAVFDIRQGGWCETLVAAVIVDNRDGIDRGALKDWINARIAAGQQKIHDVYVVTDTADAVSAQINGYRIAACGGRT